jgi:hypothetical protein
MRQLTVIISGRLKEVNDKITAYNQENYKVVFHTKKRDYPYFWRYRYTVTMADCDYLNDIGDIPQTSLSFIVSRQAMGEAMRNLGVAISNAINPIPLEEQLKEAIESEDYERAAEIRDQINGKK